MIERYSDSARSRADLDAHITRGPHVDRDEDLSEMSAELDAAEAREANAPCPSCYLPAGAHTAVARERCAAEARALAAFDEAHGHNGCAL